MRLQLPKKNRHFREYRLLKHLQRHKVKSKKPYSFTSVGHAADIGVYFDSRPTSDISHKHGGRLPLLSARPTVTFPAEESAPWHVRNYTTW